MVAVTGLRQILNARKVLNARRLPLHQLRYENDVIATATQLAHDGAAGHLTGDLFGIEAE